MKIVLIGHKNFVTTKINNSTLAKNQFVPRGTYVNKGCISSVQIKKRSKENKKWPNFYELWRSHLWFIRFNEFLTRKNISQKWKCANRIVLECKVNAEMFYTCKLRSFFSENEHEQHLILTPIVIFTNLTNFHTFFPISFYIKCNVIKLLDWDRHRWA